MVARLLYLLKRARPDILTAVGYLCTRVKQPSKNDQEKLLRVLGYLEGKNQEVLKLEPQGMLKLQAFINTSFSMHLDRKLQSGVYVSIGGAPIYYGSRKQKSISKSPTEADIVALSDDVNQVELFQELLEYMINQLFIRTTQQLLL